MCFLPPGDGARHIRVGQTFAKVFPKVAVLSRKAEISPKVAVPHPKVKYFQWSLTGWSAESPDFLPCSAGVVVVTSVRTGVAMPGCSGSLETCDPGDGGAASRTGVPSSQSSVVAPSERGVFSDEARERTFAKVLRNLQYRCAKVRKESCAKV